MKEKEKKHIAPNECSFFRWLIMTAVGVAIGVLGGRPIFRWISSLMPSSIMGIDFALIQTFLAFIFLFIGFVISLRLVAKTSLKEFILGVGGKVNVKECLLVLGLYMIGYLTMVLLGSATIRLRGVKADEYAFLVVLMLLIAWFQTTWEELIYRGILFRWACKNKLGFNKKSVGAMIATSVIFAVSHASNPEVTAHSGIYAVLAVSTYIIPGLVFAISSLHFGSLLPGILLHWINNFTAYTLLGTDGNAMPLPTLLVSGGSAADSTGGSSPIPVISLFLCSLLPYMPVLVYILWDARRKKKAASVG